MTTMTFIRHGNTDWNNEKRYQGHSHNTLSDKGRQQAQRVAQRLAKEPLDLLISSDLIARPTNRRDHLGAYRHAGGLL